jgi:hypothetical protein
MSSMIRVNARTVEAVRDRDVDVTDALVVEARPPSNPRMHASASSRMRLITRERTTNPQEVRQTELSELSHRGAIHLMSRSLDDRNQRFAVS